MTMKDRGPYNFNNTNWPGLSKLLEEAAEVIQIGAKLIATNGDRTHWDQPDLYARFEEEIGDLRAAIEFVINHNGDKISLHKITAREAEKWWAYRQWHKGEDA